MGPYASYLVQTLLTLAVVTVFAVVVLVAARRFGIGRPRGPITLVGLLPLEARRAIYLVRVLDQVIVVGASEAGFTKLGEVGAAALPIDRPPTPAFADVLARALGGRRRAGGAAEDGDRSEAGDRSDAGDRGKGA